jgi:Fe-S-cluster containining protein
MDKGFCNGCGACCNPVTLLPERIAYLMAFYHRGNPEETPEAFPELDLADPAVMEQAKVHYHNARYVVEHWTDRTIDPDGVVSLKCPFYDKYTGACKNYDDRPPICSGFPWYGEPVGVVTTTRQLPPACGYWLDVPFTERPPGWRPATTQQVQRAREKMLGLR